MKSTKRKSPCESSDSCDSSKKSKPNEPTTTTTTDSKTGPNKKKLFWAVNMASLKFVNQGADADMKYLLDATERLGEGTVQYCCLGLFVDKENGGFVLNQRYKNAIAALEEEEVKDVTLFEMIYENGVVTNIETHKCNHSEKNYYSATKDLAHAGAITSRLAWKIQYKNSFDLHVMKDQSTKIVRSKTGTLEDFKDQNGLVKYDPMKLTKSKSPIRASPDLDPNSPPIITPQDDFQNPQDDFQNALQVILRGNQEQKQYAINAIQNSLPVPQLNSNMFIYNNFAHQQAMLANQQPIQQPEIQNTRFMLNSINNEDFLHQELNSMPMVNLQPNTKQVYQENDEEQKHAEMQNEKQIPWTESDIFNI